MTEADRIYVDASQPAALKYDGKVVVCPTLEEAVVAFHNLPDALQAHASIEMEGASGGRFTHVEIQRLYYGARQTDEGLHPDELNASNDD
jgi:hypothetical protein